MSLGADWSLYLHISYHINIFILYIILLIKGFLCVSRSIAWSEEEAQKSNLFGDFKSLKEAQEFEAQSANPGSIKHQNSMLYIAHSTGTGPTPWRCAGGASMAAKTWLEPCVILRRVAPYGSLVPPFAYNIPVLRAELREKELVV